MDLACVLFNLDYWLLLPGWSLMVFRGAVCHRGLTLYRWWPHVDFATVGLTNPRVMVSLLRQLARPPEI